MADSDIAKVGSFYLRRVTSQESEKKRNKSKGEGRSHPRRFTVCLTSVN